MTTWHEILDMFTCRIPRGSSIVLILWNGVPYAWDVPLPVEVFSLFRWRSTVLTAVGDGEDLAAASATNHN